MSQIIKKRKRRPVAKKAGRKTLLTPELTSKIKAGVILGHTYRKIQNDLGILPSTWDTWVWENYQGFREKLTTYQHEYMLAQAEVNMREVLNLPTVEPVIGMFGPIVDKKTKKPILRQNDKILKIKSDMSIFVGETLGRKKYTKKLELDDVSKPKKLIILDDGDGKDKI